VLGIGVIIGTGGIVLIVTIGAALAHFIRNRLPALAGHLVVRGRLGAAQDLTGLRHALATDATGTGIELPGPGGGAATVEKVELGGLDRLRTGGSLSRLGCPRLVGRHEPIQPKRCDS
jgi:hypothetical protein